MSFETGTAGSYTLSEVDVYLRNVTGRSTSVSIRENNDSDEPGTLVGTTLTNPVSLTADSVNTFTASPGITLTAGTAYWVSVNEGIDDGADRASVARTTINSSNTNTTAETGWSFASNRLYRNGSTHAWTASSSTAMMMAVRGTSGGTTLSADATLSGLSLSNVTLDSGFTSGTTTYTADVANSVDSTTVTAETTDSNATTVVKLDGAEDTDGTVDLAVGANIITVEVTAEDTTTTETYTVTVTRAVATSTDATLSDLSLSSVTLDPTFTSARSPTRPAWRTTSRPRR